MRRTHSCQATQADVDAYRDATREAFRGRPFDIQSNGAGLRVECLDCHDSNTLNPERFIRNHRCIAA